MTTFTESPEEPGVFEFETTIGGERACVFVQPPIGDKRPGKIDSHLAGVHGKTSVEWARGESHREAALEFNRELRLEATRLTKVADDLRSIANAIVEAIDRDELP